MPVYYTKIQYTTRYDTPHLSEKQCINIQNINVSILYYARAVYLTVLMTLNAISTEGGKATEKRKLRKITF